MLARPSPSLLLLLLSCRVVPFTARNILRATVVVSCGVLLLNSLHRRSFVEPASVCPPERADRRGAKAPAMKTCTLGLLLPPYYQIPLLCNDKLSNVYMYRRIGCGWRLEFSVVMGGQAAVCACVCLILTPPLSPWFVFACGAFPYQHCCWRWRAPPCAENSACSGLAVAIRAPFLSYEYMCMHAWARGLAYCS